MIQVHNRQSREQHQDFLGRLAEMADALPSDMGTDRESLRDLLRRTPLLQLLANWTVVHYTGPDSLRESDVPPFLGLEYLTWLGVTSDPPPPLRGEWIQPETYAEVERLLDRLVDGTRWRVMTDHLRRGVAPPTPLDEAIFRARLHHLIVRSPAYAQHRKEQLIGLFSPLSADLRGLLGFDIEDAIDLIEAAGRLVEQMLNERRETAHRFVDRLSPVLAGQKGEEDLDDEELQVLAAIRARGSAADLVAELQTVTAGWLFFGIELVFTLIPPLLAKEAGRDEETARRFLTHFSLPFEQQAIGDSLPNVYEPLQQAPLINLGDDTWFAHLSGHLWEAVRPSIEASIAADRRLWDRYEHHRSQYLEESVLELLRGVSDQVVTYRGLTYEFDDGDGRRQYELDGLALVDRVAFVVECKAGGLRPAARRGAAGSLVDDLEALIGDAQRQAARSARYLQSQPNVSFQVDGDEISIARDGLRRIILCTATLDELLAFATHVASIKELVALPPDVLAWAVNLSDLRVIADLVEGAGQLVHYLGRRIALEELEISAQDELDWFGHYLHEGLFFDAALRADMPQLSIGTYTEPMDDYYLWQAGVRSEKVDKPRQKMPPLLRQLMQRLETEGPAGFVDATIMLLDGGTDERQLLARNIRDRRVRAAARGFAALRVGIETNNMLVYVAGDAMDEAGFRAYVEAARYVGKRSDTIGILERLDPSQPLLVHAVDGEWREDRAAADRAAEVMRELSSRPMPLPKPGRPGQRASRR
jgi:hypothetical protein